MVQIFQNLLKGHRRPQEHPDICALRHFGVLMALAMGKGSEWSGRSAKAFNLELSPDHDLLRIPPGLHLGLPLPQAHKPNVFVRLWHNCCVCV